MRAYELKVDLLGCGRCIEFCGRSATGSRYAFAGIGFMKDRPPATVTLSRSSVCLCACVCVHVRECVCVRARVGASTIICNQLHAPKLRGKKWRKRHV